MRNYTVENPTFTKAISIVEENDLVNEENDTAAAKQLIANDLVLNGRMEQCLGKDPAHGDSKNLIVTFDSGDAASDDTWTDVGVMQSKEEHKSLFGKISTMMKNVRYLYKLLGATDISKYGKGTVTGAIKELGERKIPDAANNGQLTIQKNGVDVQSFTADQSGNATANIIVPNTTRSAAVTQEGQLSLDAIEKNAAIPGTLAYELAQTNSNIGSRLQRIVVSGITNTGGGIPLPLYGQEMVIVSMSEISTVNRIALPVNTGVGQIYAVILGNGMQPLVDVDATVEIIYYPR